MYKDGELEERYGGGHFAERQMVKFTAIKKCTTRQWDDRYWFYGETQHSSSHLLGGIEELLVQKQIIANQ